MCYSGNMRRLAVVLALAIGCKSKEPAKQPAPAAPSDATVTVIDARPRTLEEELETIRDKYKLPAVALRVERDGKLVEEAAVGVRKLGDPTPVTREDKWHLGSNTKAMTALLLGIYVDRGTIRWTDTIGQLIGPSGTKIDPGWKDVTLDQLVRHEGGAPAEPPSDAWMKLISEGTDSDARTHFVVTILASPPAQKPGTFVYSNTGYMLAAMMLQAKTKKAWENMLRADVFKPLGMTSCGFGAPDDLGSTSGSKDPFGILQPRGHNASGTPVEPGPAADNPPGLGPAGTVHCSLADYSKFLSVYANGNPIVTPETMQHLTTARGGTRVGYAGGWMVVSKGADTMLAHSGSNTMWYATAIVIPAKKLSFVVATNKGEPKIEESLEALIKRYTQ